MTPLSRLRIFLAVAANAISPPTQAGGAPQQGSARYDSTLPPGFIPVAPADIPFYLADIDRSLSREGELALFFIGCPAIAAPFLLFRLKRRGFSRCRAEARYGGLALTARR